jgi:hypothetical protein
MSATSEKNPWASVVALAFELGDDAITWTFETGAPVVASVTVPVMEPVFAARAGAHR